MGIQQEERPACISESLWMRLGDAGVMVVEYDDGYVEAKDMLGLTFEHVECITIKKDCAEQFLQDVLDHPWYALLDNNAQPVSFDP